MLNTKYFKIERRAVSGNNNNDEEIERKKVSYNGEQKIGNERVKRKREGKRDESSCKQKKFAKTVL